MSGERQKFLRLLQIEDESIGSWETRIRNQSSRCEYENFADEFMRDQFIADLTSETLRVKLIGKGHRHQDAAQTKVKLREVFEIAKSFEANTFANQLIRTAQGTQQEQVNFTNKSTRENQFKCPFVTFMGHKLTHKGVEPDPAKVAAIREMPVSTDKAAVQRFLGMYQ